MASENTELKVAEIFKLYGHVHTYSPKEIIFQKGDDVNEIYLVSKGRVRAYCLNKYGNEITLFYINENHLIGIEAIANILIRKVNVDSITDVILYSINANVLLENCVKNKISLQDLMGFFITKVTMLSDYICCSRFLKNDEKLAYFLYSNCIREESVILQYTHEQIASVTDMNRVSVTKLLHSFVEKELISQHYKEIKVINKEGLADIFNSIGYFLD
jgi:CRP-like cAMP-binding protein